MADTSVSRRRFLRAMTAGVAGAALLNACGAGSAPEAGTSTGTEATAAPAGGEAPAPTTAAATGGTTEVRFHARIGAQEDALYDMLMPKFMEANPTIKLVKESFPGADYSTKIATMKAGNSIGDVLWSALGGALIQYQYGQDIVQPIDSLIASQNIDKSQWYEGCLNAVTVEGKLLGLPFKAHPGMAAVYYNENALADAGLEVPTKDWTQDQQVEMAKALTKSEGDRVTQWGYNPDKGWKGFVTLLRAMGGELVSEDLTKFQLNSPEGEAAAKYLWDLHHTHKVSPKPDQYINATGEAPGQMWTTGMFGLFQGGSSVSNFGNTIGDKFKWMVVGNAKGPGGVGGSDFEADCFALSTSARNVEASFEWIKELCSHEAGVQLGLIGGTIGGRPDVYGDPRITATNFRPVFKELMDNAQASRIVGNWRQGEAETAFGQLMTPLWTGEAEPTKAFLDDVTAQIQTIFDKPRA
jgi:multiple sugar transport system substrate-binding protein